jgi:hypothetical protein
MFRLLIVAAALLLSLKLQAIAIYTPANTENNKFAIKCSNEWGYRTLKGDNGLIGVMWPATSTFNLTGTAVFIFVQDNRAALPKVPCNINIFREKCTGADFKFSTAAENKNYTKSIGEKYFKGRCGRTTVIFEEKVGQYIIIFFFVSDKYVTKKQFAEVKEALKGYKEEVEKYIIDNPELHQQPPKPPTTPVAETPPALPPPVTPAAAAAAETDGDNSGEADGGGDGGDDGGSNNSGNSSDNAASDDASENNNDEAKEETETETETEAEENEENNSSD